MFIRVNFGDRSQGTHTEYHIFSCVSPTHEHLRPKFESIEGAIPAADELSRYDPNMFTPPLASSNRAVLQKYVQPDIAFWCKRAA